MNPKNHIFKFYSDPAHGWLEMPSKLVKELNMGFAQISEFSYYDKKRDFVYIEQDCDLLNVKREYEKKFKQKLLDPDRVVHIDLDEDNFIRKLPPYVTYTVECHSATPIESKEILNKKDQKLALVKTFLQDSQWMDFSNYPPDHKNYNKEKHLVPGFFKDENGMCVQCSSSL